MAKTSIINVSLSDNGLEFAVADVGVISLDLTNLTADIRHQAMIHGLTQKVSDAAALGKEATASDKFSAMQSVVERLIGPEGSWNKRSGEGSGPVAGLIFRAVAEYARTAINPGLTDDQIRGWYDDKDRKEQLALRSVPAVREIMDRMRAEKGGAAKVDVDALLSGLVADMPKAKPAKKTKA